MPSYKRGLKKTKQVDGVHLIVPINDHIFVREIHSTRQNGHDELILVFHPVVRVMNESKAVY